MQLQNMMMLKIKKLETFIGTQDIHPNKKDKKLIGFIAQELEEVFPGVITKTKRYDTNRGR